MIEGSKPTALSNLGAQGVSRPPTSGKKRIRRLLLWVVGLLVLVAICLGIAVQIAFNRAEPMLRAKVVETLETRFDSRVELGPFQVSVIRGFEIEGENLRLYPRRFRTDQPLIAIAKFRFRVSWLSVMRTPIHVNQVTVEGMAINIPPKEDRLPDPQQLATQNASTGAATPKIGTPTTGGQTANPGIENSGIKIVVDHVVIENTRLLIGTSKPGKLPLDFEISRIALHSIGPGKPMKFEATLINPRPVGNIESAGYFGPFRQDSPGETPVSGTYVFSHADLATFKGIAGILSSTGKYRGPLNRLTVDGQATVPDFRLTTGNHPMLLRTVFHAIVDGTSGDTYLEPVQAQLARSRFTVSGSVVKVRGTGGGPHGHDITLDVVMNNARVEDFLRLAVHTDPPLMSGNLHMKARMFLPPGEVPVPQKLELKGDFDITDAYFSGQNIQQKVNQLSHLGQGHPKDPDLHVNPPQPEVNTPAEVKGDFTLAQGKMDFPDLDFNVPGAKVDVAGVYTLDGSKFDFHGQAKLDAHVSQMTTGWKSLLLKMADPFFAKQGYGTVVPFQINGTKSEPHFGLDFGHKSGLPEHSR